MLNSCEDRATVTSITPSDLVDDYYFHLATVGLSPAAMMWGAQAEYIKDYAWMIEQLLGLIRTVNSLAPFVNRPMAEKCAARTRELHKYFVAGFISYDYVYHTLKQEFGVELVVKPKRRA